MVAPESRSPDLAGVDPDLAEQLDDYHGEQASIEIWPENETAVSLFERVQTQWRVGMAGPTGLDYPGVEVVMRLLAPEEPLDTLDRVRVMEHEALSVFRENRD